MGHIRLSMFPGGKQWRAIIELIRGDASASSVAAAILDAVNEQFAAAAEDPGFLHAYWLLTQLPAAARDAEYVAALRTAGLAVSDAPSMAELVSSFSDAVDAELRKSGKRTDLGEIGQLAAIEALAKVVGTRTDSLFETGPVDVQRAVAALGTSGQFSDLGREFFARFSERFIEYYASRQTPLEVGPGKRFTTLGDLKAFESDLKQHCFRAARIVEEFSGDWYSKARFEGNLTPDGVQRFLAYALKKMRTELNRDRLA